MANYPPNVGIAAHEPGAKQSKTAEGRVFLSGSTKELRYHIAEVGQVGVGFNAHEIDNHYLLERNQWPVGIAETREEADNRLYKQAKAEASEIAKEKRRKLVDETERE